MEDHVVETLLKQLIRLAYDGIRHSEKNELRDALNAFKNEIKSEILSEIKATNGN